MSWRQLKPKYKQLQQELDTAVAAEKALTHSFEGKLAAAEQQIVQIVQNQTQVNRELQAQLSVAQAELSTSRIKLYRTAIETCIMAAASIRTGGREIFQW